MSYNPKYPYTRDELTSRQIRTTKRMRSSAWAVTQGLTFLRAMQLDSQWDNAGKLFGLIVPATVPVAEVPAIGSAITIRNRETGLVLGVYRIVPATEGDEMWAHPITAWELCALSDHRTDRTSKNVSQTASQPSATTVPAIAVGTAGRPSTRERVSHFTSATPEPTPEPTRVPATAGRKARR